MDSTAAATASVRGAATALADSVAGVTGGAESAQLARLGAKTFGASIIELLCEDLQQIYCPSDWPNWRILIRCAAYDKLHEKNNNMKRLKDTQ